MSEHIQLNVKSYTWNLSLLFSTKINSSFILTMTTTRHSSIYGFGDDNFKILRSWLPTMVFDIISRGFNVQADPDGRQFSHRHCLHGYLIASLSTLKKSPKNYQCFKKPIVISAQWNLFKHQMSLCYYLQENEHKLNFNSIFQVLR